jgi:hypothetical protein
LNDGCRREQGWKKKPLRMNKGYIDDKYVISRKIIVVGDETFKKLETRVKGKQSSTTTE